MTTKLATPSIAIIAANGVDENHITAVQRALTSAELSYQLVAPEQGLVNGWQNNSWGHYFTVDQPLSTAMGSDYDCLILVGGERGTSKLSDNPHTRRIVNHFLESGKPVSAIETGVDLLALSPKSASLTVAAVEASTDKLNTAQMEIVEDAQSQDGSVLTSNGSDIDAWVGGTLALFTAYIDEAAAQEEQAA